VVAVGNRGAVDAGKQPISGEMPLRHNLADKRRLAMRLGEETLELDLIAKALRTISRETSYRGLAEAILEAALEYSGAACC
jgi:hypothetical protein